MKKGWVIIFTALCACACGRSGDAQSGDAAQASGSASDASADSLESRIESLTVEMEDYIKEYENSPSEETFNRAMALNDSLERIDTTSQGHFYNKLLRSQLLAKAGKVKEAMRLQESLLSKDPDDLARLQFYAGKFWLEEKTDSMQYYAHRAIAVCDKELAAAANDPQVREQVLLSKLSIYQMLNDRVRAREVSDQLHTQQLGDPTALTDEEFNEEFDEAREELNKLAVAWRNDDDEGHQQTHGAHQQPSK